MLAPSGSAKLATVREILRSCSAAASIVGSVASDDVVEKAIAIDGQLALRKRAALTRTTSTTAGSNNPALNTARPAVTASAKTAILGRSDQPYLATATAASAKM